MNTYFKDCKTEQETRNLYVSLAKILHPDRGGSTRDFQEMQNQYEAKLKSLHGSYNSEADAKEGKRKYEYNAEVEKDLMNMLHAIQGLQLPETVEISLNGSWIWVRGCLKNHYGYYPVDSRHHAQLERLGLKYHTMKGEFYYRDSKNKCKNKGKVMSYDRINKRYSGFKVSNFGSEQIN